MKKKIIKILCIELLFLLSGVCVASAIKVNSEINYSSMYRGNWLYVGGGDPSNYSRIQDAIDNASNGDTVFVYDDSSPYQENIRINKEITLIGENRDTTIISGLTGQDHVVRISSKNVIINGFTIKGAAGGQDGISVFPLMELCMISNNIIKDSSYGILLQATSSKITISDNIISNNNFQGIYLQGSNRNIITNNLISGNGDYGIALDVNSVQNWIINNTVENNFGGIKFSGSSSQNNISGNKICNNNMEGVLITGVLSNSNEITVNKITKNKFGIKISSSSKNVLTSNNISENILMGIYLAGSNENIIKMNNFIKNKKNARFVISFNNIWDFNYWDDWVGNRFENPIFKKFPKSISGFVLHNFDSNPQEEPYDL